MQAPDPYQPPCTLSSSILALVAAIAEISGRVSSLTAPTMAPQLRRANQIRTIHASLAIENNTLTLAQVTAVFDGKHVAGHPREIQEVRNAIVAYDGLAAWSPHSMADLLAAHKAMMAGLANDAGAFRSGGVGVFHGGELVHMAPPARRLPSLMGDLLNWLKRTPEHPLVAGCLAHYELEFIHPFSDGNGRMGRLWQTLILRGWRPWMAMVPVESVVRMRQEEYYRALAEADTRADAAPFVEFMLAALLEAVQDSLPTDQVSDQVSDQVLRLMQALVAGPRRASDLMTQLGLAHRPTFRRNYVDPALRDGWIERTQPESPRSPTQSLRLSDKGWMRLDQQAG